MIGWWRDNVRVRPHKALLTLAKMRPIARALGGVGCQSGAVDIAHIPTWANSSILVEVRFGTGNMQGAAQPFGGRCRRILNSRRFRFAWREPAAPAQLQPLQATGGDIANRPYSCAFGFWYRVLRWVDGGRGSAWRVFTALIRDYGRQLLGDPQPAGRSSCSSAGLSRPSGSATSSARPRMPCAYRSLSP